MPLKSHQTLLLTRCQGHIIPFRTAESQACKAQARIADALEFRRRRCWCRFRCCSYWCCECRFHRLPVSGKEHADEQTHGPALRSGCLRIHDFDECAGTGHVQWSTATDHRSAGYHRGRQRWTRKGATSHCRREDLSLDIHRSRCQQASYRQEGD